MVAHFAVNTVYIVINASYAYNHTVGAVVSMPVSLLELLIGAAGVMLFLRRKEWKPIWDGTFGIRSSLTPQRMTMAALTSVPALVVLVLTIYFISGNLEVL